MDEDLSRIESPDSEQVIEPLADPACRRIIYELDGPMAAQ